MELSQTRPWVHLVEVELSRSIPRPLEASRVKRILLIKQKLIEESKQQRSKEENSFKVPKKSDCSMTKTCQSQEHQSLKTRNHDDKPKRNRHLI